jgi:hypothetical protein
MYTQNKDIHNLALTEVLIVLGDTLQFIKDCSGIDLKIENIDKNIDSDEDQHELWFRIKNNKICFTFSVDDKDHTKEIKTCRVLFNSPLYSRHKNEWVIIKDLGSLVDYTILHVCPDLLLIRNLQYISKLMDTPSHFNITIDTTNGANDDIYFLIENKSSDKKIKITFQSKDGTNLQGFVHIKGTHTHKLVSYSEWKNAVHIGDDVEFVEHGFASFPSNSICPHPATVQNIKFILKTLNIDDHVKI